MTSSNQSINQSIKSYAFIKIMKFEDKVGNQSKCWNFSPNCQISKCCNLSEIVWIDQNIEIWGQYSWELIKVFKFQCKMSNWTKCWNLSAKYQINQNDAIWLKEYESIKMLKFDDKIGNQSKCQIKQSWNLSAKYQIDQNDAIWVKK